MPLGHLPPNKEIAPYHDYLVARLARCTRLLTRIKTNLRNEEQEFTSKTQSPNAAAKFLDRIS